VSPFRLRWEGLARAREVRSHPGTARLGVAGPRSPNALPDGGGGREAAARRAEALRE